MAGQDFSYAFRAPGPGNFFTADFTNCTGPINTPGSFEARGPLTPPPAETGSTIFQLIGSPRNYVVKRAVRLSSGKVLKDTPGFDHNAVDVATCLTEGGDVRTWGILTPRGGH